MSSECTGNNPPDIIIAGISCYTPNALAKALEKKKQTLAGWRTRGFGPSYITLGRKIVYPQGEVLNWLNSRTVNPSNIVKK